MTVSQIRTVLSCDRSVLSHNKNKTYLNDISVNISINNVIAGFNSKLHIFCSLGFHTFRLLDIKIYERKHKSKMLNSVMGQQLFHDYIFLNVAQTCLYEGDTKQLQPKHNWGGGG